MPAVHQKTLRNHHRNVRNSVNLLYGIIWLCSKDTAKDADFIIDCDLYKLYNLCSLYILYNLCNHHRKGSENIKTLVFCIQKGGVGKTSIAHSTAIGLLKRGNSVLCVDVDSQANLSVLFGIGEPDDYSGTYEVLTGKVKISDVIIHTDSGADLCPASIDLSAIDLELSGTMGREYLLFKALRDVSGNYDYCVIDTPPALGLSTINALTAADFVVIPVTADDFSVRGIRQLNRTIEVVKKNCNPDLVIAGYLLNRTDNTKLTKAISDALRQGETRVFQHTIRQAVAVRESQLFKTDAFSEGSRLLRQDIDNYLDELLTTIAERNEHGKK